MFIYCFIEQKIPGKIKSQSIPPTPCFFIIAKPVKGPVSSVQNFASIKELVCQRFHNPAMARKLPSWNFILLWIVFKKWKTQKVFFKINPWENILFQLLIKIYLWRCVSTSMLAHPKSYIIVERIKFFWVFTFTLSRNSWLVKVFTFTLSRKFSLSLFPESFHFHSLQDQLIGESLFRVFDEDNSGSLNFSEYLQVFRLLEIYLQNIRICQK